MKMLSTVSTAIHQKYLATAALVYFWLSSSFSFVSGSAAPFWEPFSRYVVILFLLTCACVEYCVVPHFIKDREILSLHDGKVKNRQTKVLGEFRRTENVILLLCTDVLARVMIATKEEMQSAKIPIEDRDYCAHKLINYRACRAYVFPFVYQYHHEKHDYLNCEYEDYILRMKEFERERRLTDRQNRIAKRNGE